MIFGREPALFAGLINAILALAVTFGAHLTPEQTGAILAVVNIALALIVRQSVTPTGAPVLSTGTKVTTPEGDAAVVSGAAPSSRER
jgi:hypothetical protein